MYLFCVVFLAQTILVLAVCIPPMHLRDTSTRVTTSGTPLLTSDKSTEQATVPTSHGTGSSEVVTAALDHRQISALHARAIHRTRLSHHLPLLHASNAITLPANIKAFWHDRTRSLFEHKVASDVLDLKQLDEAAAVGVMDVLGPTLSGITSARSSTSRPPERPARLGASRSRATIPKPDAPPPTLLPRDSVPPTIFSVLRARSPQASVASIETESDPLTATSTTSSESLLPSTTSAFSSTSPPSASPPLSSMSSVTTSETSTFEPDSTSTSPTLTTDMSSSSSSTTSVTSSSSTDDDGDTFTTSYSTSTSTSSSTPPPWTSTETSSSRSSTVALPPSSTPSSSRRPSRTTPTFAPSTSSRPTTTSRLDYAPTPIIVSNTSTGSTLSSTSAANNSAPLTITSTIVFTTTLLGGGSTTVTTVIETGVLGTNLPSASSFSRNTGAIIGVSVAAAFGIILIGLLLFFACKRIRQRRIYGSSFEKFMGPSTTRRTPWRPPLGGDDDESFLEYRARTGTPPEFKDHIVHGRSRDGSAEECGPGSAESGAVHGPPLSTTFGGQEYMPSQGILPNEVFDAVPVGAVFPTSRRSTSPDFPEMTQVPRSDVLVQPGPDTHQPSASDGSLPKDSEAYNTHSNESALSLTIQGGNNSSTRHTSGKATRSSSTHHHPRHSDASKRTSLPGPRPMPPSTSRRHSSTPANAYLGSQQRNVDRRASTKPQGTGIRNLFQRLRNTSHLSTLSISTIRAGKTNSSSSDDSMPPITIQPGPPIPTHIASAFESPSYPNSPARAGYRQEEGFVIQPLEPVLHFPRGVTGSSYRAQREGDGPYRPPINTTTGVYPWPTNLPPSPVLTDNSSLVEGLLHPRLSNMARARSEQASVMSLRDHEDYSRPISGHVHNHVRSTTTFETSSSIEA